MRALIASLILTAAVPVLAQAKTASLLTPAQQAHAVNLALGLGCSVQDRSTERAAAWSATAMGAAARLTQTSKDASLEFAQRFYATDAAAKAGGGYPCAEVPKLPGQAAPKAH